MKKDKKDQQEFHLTTLSAGAVIGEMALLANSLRAATIRTLTPVRLVTLPIQYLRSLKASTLVDEQLIYYKIVENIALELRNRIDKANQALIDLMHDNKLDTGSKTARFGMFADLFRY